MFQSLKNDLVGLPLRVQEVDVVKGMIFVNFVALIISPIATIGHASAVKDPKDGAAGRQFRHQ